MAENKTHTVIQLRRTALDIKDSDVITKIKTEGLDFGEPFFENQTNYLIVGDNKNDFEKLPRVKLVEKELAENVVYSNGNKLINNAKQQIYPETNAENVTYDSGNVYTAILDLETKTANISGNYKYAAAEADGGAAKKVVSVEDNTSTEVFVTGVTQADTTAQRYNKNVKIDCSKGILKGAAWNDFAEFRTCKDKDVEAGHCVIENGDGSMSRSTKRLQSGASIISDTFGMVIGEESDHTRPIAIAGRVLAYTFDRCILKAGDAVCSGEYGSVSKMSRLEMILHPDCIIGYVSEIPDYSFWNDQPVNGRIWIKLK